MPLQLLRRLRHRGALGQQMVDHKGRLNGTAVPWSPCSVVGKVPVVELPSHKPLVIDAFVEDGRRGDLQKPHPTAAYRRGGRLLAATSPVREEPHTA